MGCTNNTIALQSTKPFISIDWLSMKIQCVTLDWVSSEFQFESEWNKCTLYGTMWPIAILRPAIVQNYGQILNVHTKWICLIPLLVKYYLFQP